MTDTDSIELMIKKAREAYTAKHYDLAGKVYLEIALKYESDGKPLDAAEMRNNGSVALLKAGCAGEALKAVEGTPAIFEQAGDQQRQAIALANQAAAYEDLHRLDEAVRDYRQALELLRKPNDREMKSMILKRISAIQMRTGKPVHALAAMDAAVDAASKQSFGDRLIQWLMGIIRKLTGQT